MATQAEKGAAKPAKRSALKRFVVAPLRAGLLAVGVFFWALGIFMSVRRQYLFSLHPTEETVFLGSFLLAAAVTVSRGYRGPVRSYLGLAGRFAGGLAGAMLVTGVYVAVAMRFDHGTVTDRLRMFAVSGMVFTGLAVAWLRGRKLLERMRASPRARWIAGGVVAALALMTAWPLSPGLRCALGSGDGCVRAARRAIDEGDEAQALSLAERGCSLDDADACRVAGDGLWGGYSGGETTPRDRTRAEPFYRTACALGDDEGCQSLHVLELHGRCEGQRASACRELGQVYRSGQGVSRDGSAASRFLRQACLLGDTEACAQGR